jgi:transposase
VFELLATLEPCKIGMEACSGAHDTAHRLKAMGHDARIIASKYVVKFRQKQKNDASDAEAFLRDLAISHYALYPDQEHRATGRSLPGPDSRCIDSCPHQSDQ